MKRLMIPLLLLTVSCLVRSQSFEISTMPRVQSVKVGETAKFTVTVTPQDGYDATVLCQATLPAFNLKLRVTPDYVNAPFSAGMVVEFTPLVTHIGNHQIVIEAWNGSLRSYDTVAVDVEGFPDRPGWTRYLSANSPLPSDTITALAFDTDGSAWIGTTDGLAKFDGSAWTVFKSLNNGDSILTSNNVMSLAVDSSNVIWIGTREGISRRAGNVWTIYRKGQGFPVGDSLTLNIVSLATSPTLDVHALERTVNASGKVTGCQLWTMEGEAWTAAPIRLNYYQVAVDVQGRTYVLSNDTLARFDDQFRSVFPGAYGSNIDLDHLGRVWTSAGSGIKRLDGGTWKIRTLPGAPSSSIGVVAYDHVDGAWVSVQYAGVAHFNGFSWETYDISDHQAVINRITAIQVHHDGTVWAGTNGGGLLILNPDEVSSTGTPHPNRALNADLLSVGPNPSTGTSWIRLVLASPGRSRLTLVNSLGQEVLLMQDELLEAGAHIVRFNAAQLPVGNYFVRLNHAGTTEVRSIVVAR